MKLQFNCANLDEVFRLQAMLPWAHTQSFTLSFGQITSEGESLEKVTVLYTVSAITGQEIEKYFSPLMKKTYQFKDNPVKPDVGSRIYSFTCDYFSEVKRLITVMPREDFRAVTVFFNAFSSHVRVLLHMEDDVHVKELSWYFSLIEEGEALMSVLSA